MVANMGLISVTLSLCLVYFANSFQIKKHTHHVNFIFVNIFMSNFMYRLAVNIFKLPHNVINNIKRRTIRSLQVSTFFIINYATIVTTYSMLQLFPTVSVICNCIILRCCHKYVRLQMFKFNIAATVLLHK